MTFKSSVNSAAGWVTLRPMVFSVSATQALRAVSWLAANGGREAVMGGILAKKLKLPLPYLTKVLGALTRTGVLTATRGVKGGYRLARPPDRIRLMEVVEPFEGKRVRPGCLFRPGQPCRDFGACAAHQSYGKVKRVYLEWLEGHTVADIQGAPESGVPSRPARAARARMS